MASPTVPTAEASDVSADTDLYCLTCGYNLRGLTGDPRRCPECFAMNPIGDLVLPAERIRQALRQLQTAPTVCVTAVLIAVPFAVLAVSLTLARAPFDAGGAACIASGILVPGAFWFGGALSFRESCAGDPRWFSALARFQLYGVAMCVVVFLSVTGIVAGLFTLAKGPLIPATIEGSFCALLSIGVVIVFVSGLIVRPVVRSVAGRATRELTTLQRQVAVRIAREELRREIVRRR